MAPTKPASSTADSVGVANLPNQRYKIVCKKGCSFNLMLVGDSGLGKTTYMNTLFTTLLKHPRSYSNRHNNHTPSSTLEINALHAEVEERGFVVQLGVIDTPGFGDAIDNGDSWKTLVDFVESKHEDFLMGESKAERTATTRKEDHRVHACIYFLFPSGGSIKQLDVITMQQLATRTNLIPVIAKADMLTPQELLDFKETVRNTIRESNIRVFSCAVDEDSPADEKSMMANLSLQDDKVGLDAEVLAAMPYSIVASTQEVANAAGKKVIGRAYPWGVVEIENDAHCDFRKLRSLLIRTHMYDLIQSTEQVHYENYRCKRLGGGLNESQDPEMRQKMRAAFEQRVKMEEENLRHRFTEQVKQEEMRFRKWEKKLIEERDRLNANLQQESDAIKRLQSEISLLEATAKANRNAK